MVICLERGAYLHMAQLMPLPLTVSCFSKIQIGFTFLVPAHPSDLTRFVVVVVVCIHYITFVRALPRVVLLYVSGSVSVSLSCSEVHSS